MTIKIKLVLTTKILELKIPVLVPINHKVYLLFHLMIQSLTVHCFRQTSQFARREEYLMVGYHFFRVYYEVIYLNHESNLISL